MDELISYFVRLLRTQDSQIIITMKTLVAAQIIDVFFQLEPYYYTPKIMLVSAGGRI